MKRQAKDWKKIFASHVSNIGPIPRIIKNHHNSMVKISPTRK
jgi:hypothetical protein